ncbi:hypothetical protein GO730_20010 [Spirosoma sp. HMF3257]|nr:hypothetical protein [Spirosoma telluris]
MKAAWIATLTTLLVVGLQSWQQKKRDEEQQNSTEQKKMKYLNFIIQDTYKIVEFYNSNSQKLVNTFNINPFLIEEYSHYSAQSLEVIVNKLNQEDYYLASTTQLKGDDIAEVFLIYNALYLQIKDTKGHHIAEMEKLKQTQDDFSNSISDLQESINKLLLTKNFNSDKEKLGQRQLNELMGKIKPIILKDQPYKSRLFDSKNVFIEPVIKTLEPYDGIEGDLRNVLLKAYDARIKYNLCVVHLRNMIDYITTNGKEINYEITRIKELTEPLEAYIKKLPK